MINHGSVNIETHLNIQTLILQSSKNRFFGVRNSDKTNESDYSLKKGVYLAVFLR